jgi:(1->4)-alpha-D-glucan 1-alpha-D-glucosylmutase
MTVPGVPDFYQGSELWDFNLVDPDNRRPVDFDERRDRLDNLLQRADESVEQLAVELREKWPDPDVKLWVTTRSLWLRREWPEVFSYGEYLPVAAIGPAADHVISFARCFEGRWAVVVVPRHFQPLRRGDVKTGDGVPRADWGGTELVLPDAGGGSWRCELSGRVLKSDDRNGQLMLRVDRLFDVLPVALLTLHSESP